jgi:predicted signal transduction protein with EAL and GGDEF domain
VSELKRAEERIRHLAYYDGITGLPNRQYFMERLQHALVQARRHNRLLGVLSLDLDQFKRINDTWDTAAGNELLFPSPHGSQTSCGAKIPSRAASMKARTPLHGWTATSSVS